MATPKDLPQWQMGEQTTGHRRYGQILVWLLRMLWLLSIAGLAQWLSSVVTPPMLRWFEGVHPQPQPYAALPLKPVPRGLQRFQKCSITNMRSMDVTFGADARPLKLNEFVQRRDRLATALVDEDVDAFIVEPGYTFSYYANVTQPDWEVWEPEERPFLMVVKPHQSYDANGGLSIVANTTFLVPSFEEERARLLRMPFDEPISTITYEEHWNPYQALLDSHFLDVSEQKTRVMVDEEMRDFISRGLANNGLEVLGLGGKVEEVRQRKTQAEVEILRAVNTGTVEAVRAMRKCMARGLSEADVAMVLDNTLRAAGLDPFFDIVLFDENASNPHGGTDGSKKLKADTMVLVDVGAHLYGYSSDTCRSFFPPFTQPPETQAQHDALDESMKEKLYVWEIVLDAQTASLIQLHANATAASVDIAARTVIEKAGYGEAFTHRVGHGIGIKAHESPYLNKGNVDTLLKADMAFTSEPGIYLVEKFGVRHEDVLLVQQDGMPELLTGKRASGPWDP